MSRRLEFLLREWGQYVERHLEWHNEFGENILHRAGLMTGRGGTPGHRILAPECPPKIRRVDQAVRRLTEKQADAIFCWYCLPLKPDTNQRMTVQEIANLLGIDRRSLRHRLDGARKNLRKSI